MIQFTHVTKVLGDNDVILDDISFLIHRGEFVFLTGPSGAGKTTLLKHIYMDEFPTKGQTFVSGFHSQDLQKYPEQIPFLRRKMGIVFQDFKLFPDRNVFENVAITLRITGEKEKVIKKKVLKVLSEVGLSHKMRFDTNNLSWGEQQRVAIARAIINDPYVLLADEPTGNLDIDTGQEIVQLLRRINENGTAVLMATHDLHLIETMPFRVLRLENGRLVSRAYAT